MKTKEYTYKLIVVYCPFCGTTDTRVIDSRLSNEGHQVRRRRECPNCSARFTTLESADIGLPRIIKRDNSRSAFVEKKLRAGILRALEKRPISSDQVEQVMQRLLRRLRSTDEREIPSRLLGEWVMEELRVLDPVAYVRFASVYRSFQDVEAFNEIIKQLKDYAPLAKTENIPPAQD